MQPMPTPSVAIPAAPPRKRFPPNQKETKVSEILANPQRFLDEEVEIVGKLENKGANIQLRSGRDFQLSDSSGSIPVNIQLPLEVERNRTGSYKATLANVLNEHVRAIAKVDIDPATGRPRLTIKNATVIEQ